MAPIAVLTRRIAFAIRGRHGGSMFKDPTILD
jgi:hypothetical protein